MNENDVYVVGKDKAIVSFVLGLVSLLSCFTGIGSIVGLITGIIGLVYANKAKSEGYLAGFQSAGFICSLLGLILSILMIILFIIIIGTFTSFVASIPYYDPYSWYY